MERGESPECTILCAEVADSFLRLTRKRNCHERHKRQGAAKQNGSSKIAGVETPQ